MRSTRAARSVETRPEATSSASTRRGAGKSSLGSLSLTSARCAESAQPKACRSGRMTSSETALQHDRHELEPLVGHVEPFARAAHFFTSARADRHARRGHGRRLIAGAVSAFSINPPVSIANAR